MITLNDNFQRNFYAWYLLFILGAIGVEELEDPLIALGLAQNR